MDDREYEPTRSSEGLTLSSLREFFRIAGTVLGLGVILIGCVFAVRIFGALYSGITEPDDSRQMVAAWAEIVGGEEDLRYLEHVVEITTGSPADHTLFRVGGILPVRGRLAEGGGAAARLSTVFCPAPPVPTARIP